LEKGERADDNKGDDGDDDRKRHVRKVHAKWCSLADGADGFQWDETKIKCLLSQRQRDDAQLMHRLVEGKVVTGQMHPLIFKWLPKSMRRRSGSGRSRSSNSCWQTVKRCRKVSVLSEVQKRLVAVGVRDLFLAAGHGLLNDQEKELLHDMLKILDETVASVQARAVNISFYPSSSFKVVKLMEGVEYMVGPELVHYFAQVMQSPRLFVVFVDPIELSFHNFENIFPSIDGSNPK